MTQCSRVTKSKKRLVDDSRAWTWIKARRAMKAFTTVEEKLKTSPWIWNRWAWKSVRRFSFIMNRGGTDWGKCYKNFKNFEEKVRKLKKHFGRIWSLKFKQTSRFLWTSKIFQKKSNKSIKLINSEGFEPKATLEFNKFSLKFLSILQNFKLDLQFYLKKVLNFST